MESVIKRNPVRAAEDRYDLVIVGGGIYGACLALQTARRGLRPLLLERDDFGGATSWNSLRILHGGLRYLQTLDLPRFRESVAERRWFCRHFPDLVRPMPCLMPLYGQGLKRPSTFRIALWMNDWLSCRRNNGVRPECHLPSSRILNRQETQERFPRVARDGLQGAGLWYDSVMPNSQRILMEILRWACGAGAVALNYVEATRLLTDGERVVGVEGYDRVSGQTLAYDTGKVVNCAGPWSRWVAQTMDRDLGYLFQPSLAYNVLINKEPLSNCALAVGPRRPGAQIYFMHPWQGKILLGTRHEPWTGPLTSPWPSESQVHTFLSEVNEAVPGWDLKPEDILRTYAGWLPTHEAGASTLTKREVIYDHAHHGGPQGLISLCGIKYTTSRRVAEKALAQFSPDWARLPLRSSAVRNSSSYTLDLTGPDEFLNASDDEAEISVRRLMEEEAVVTMDDLLLRRTDWAGDPQHEETVRQSLTRRLSESEYQRLVSPSALRPRAASIESEPNEVLMNP